MRPTVLLYDIDGTLVTTGGVGRRALELAFERLHGRPDACAHFPFAGMTDRAIARGGLTAIDVEATDATIDAVLAAYIELLREGVKQADPAKYLVHPGVRESLSEALECGEVAVGLGTGNIRAGAQVKLEHVGLFEHFAFGGFGCDAEDRTALIRRGAERGAERLGAPMEACRIVVIGDTPKDVAAARAIGAECLGVGTGSFSAEELRACGATYAFKTLAEPNALATLLGRVQAVG